MAKDIRVRAEQEADKIGAQFAYSSDVVNDMSRIYHVDFSKIQIHTDEAAEQKVRAAGKDGLAQGNHLFFGRGIFGSNTPEDKMLVAHELVHTMQQQVTDGGMAVSEHVPMGMAQYGRVRKNRFDPYTWEAIEEEGYELDNEDADGNFELTEDDIDIDDATEAIDYACYEEETKKRFEVHHFATNKHSFYSKIFAYITKFYDLDLDGDWNKEKIEHHGRHPLSYHELVLKKMIEIHERIQNNINRIVNPKNEFIKLFNKEVKMYVKKHPEILYNH